LEHPRQRRRSHGPLEPVAEEGRGKNEVMQPANPATNAIANAPANATANAPANPAAKTPTNVPANVVGNVANNADNDATSRGMPLQTQGQIQELNLRRCKLIAQKAISVNA
jgi:hypothetical protein